MWPVPWAQLSGGSRNISGARVWWFSPAGWVHLAMEGRGWWPGCWWGLGAGVRAARSHEGCCFPSRYGES